jgi:CheY-like chemotaxis protein
MDVQMPKMDGHEATRILRKNRYQKPIIALTAHAMKDEKQKCIESGFSGFLSKPIQRKALIEVLENLYRGSFPFDQGTNL